MAVTTLVPIGSVGIRACANSGHLKPDQDRRKTSSAKWTPIFGWSSEPDYIDTNNTDKSGDESESISESRPRFARGCFTKEKARQLRLMMTKETDSFHDTMYHSAIASRLASDFKTRCDL
ncbi:hypothetical protein L6164_014390 [Bauhinia variegata]|uniref:Uncharacterized protein n=1 Tax=Bauhinia variegata TaxID=167791 RepID=A0ACB9NM01_BAUVA|nr:hypothetical protein L6164_014390 [Bauhinia variegata]